MASSTYRDAPLLLNLERKEDGSYGLASTWCNLGHWPQSSFSEACQALARKLGTAVGLSAGDEVLDCGVGYADQCELWTSEYGVLRVVALELYTEHVEAARSRLRTRWLGSVVEVHAGSATALPAAVSAAAAGCDVVLCLDCAYHFDTREQFLQAAGGLLRHGGRFGAVDILPSDVGWGWRRVAQLGVAAACNIPFSNLYGVGEYRASLRRAGLEVTALETLSPQVFAPFAANAALQRQRLGSQLRWSEWGFLHAISAIMGFIARHRLFDAVLVTAERR